MTTPTSGAGGAYAGPPGSGGYPPPTGGASPGYGPPGSAGYDSGPRQPAGEQRDVGEVSVGQLIGEVTRDLSTLMRQELALARAELKQEASKTATGVGAYGGAALAGFMTALFLSIALWWALSHLVGLGWSALIVAVLWGILGAILYGTGRTKFRQVHPTPERTVDTLKQVPDALKGQRGGTP